MISLADLLAGLIILDPIWDRKITAITLDSRQVISGSLFIAIKGQIHDGRDFIPQALTQGAAAIIAEADEHPALKVANQPIFVLANLPQYLGLIAARYYQHPSRQLKMVGITGTNGKTSCTHFIAQVLERLGQPCGIIGTLGYGRLDQLKESARTTPDALSLQRYLADFRDAKIGYVAMEVSSHALVQHRVKQIEFDIGVFTNLTRDHLDYHGSMAAYGAAKQGLFQQFGLAHAIINVDDEFGRNLKETIPPGVKIYTYSIQQAEADLIAKQIKLTSTGIQTELLTPWGQAPVTLPLIGRFNLSNVLAVVGILSLLGVSWQDIVSNLAKLKPVVGRMHLIRRENHPLFVVDYAHTPDALQQALLALREHCQGRLWCVFGCGGDRDPGKRPEMGKVASQLADRLILTDDNPRHENSADIIQQILAGVDANSIPIIIEPDRRQAITRVIEEALPNDVVLVAGKGHESYQQVGDHYLAFNDTAVIESLI